jgi:hypothetical protein
MAGRPLVKILFPGISRLLARVVKRENAKTRKLPVWRERQTTNFLRLVAIMVKELDGARRRGRMPTLAYTSRCLLELSIWTEYCCASEENAKRFRDDTVRDFYGMSKAFMDIDRQRTGADDAELTALLDRLTDFVKTQGLEKLDDDFKRVSQAARELGKHAIFLNYNKLLSKLAHPSAWMVHSAKTLKADKSYRNEIFDVGARFGLQSVEHIRAFIVQTFPEAARQKYRFGRIRRKE